MATASQPYTSEALEARPPAIIARGVVIELPDMQERAERLAVATGAVDLAIEEVRRESVLPTARTHMQALMGEKFGWRRSIRTLQHAEGMGRTARTLTEELLGQAAQLIENGKITPPVTRAG